MLLFLSMPFAGLLESEVLIAFLAEVGPKLLTLGGLILIDVVLGIALAIQQRRFQWGKVLSFYLTMVVPYLLGWLVFALALPMINAAYLPADVVGWLNPAIVNGSWIVIVVVLARSILRNVAPLYGELKKRLFSPGDTSDPVAPGMEVIHAGTVIDEAKK